MSEPIETDQRERRNGERRVGRKRKDGTLASECTCLRQPWRIMPPSHICQTNERLRDRRAQAAPASTPAPMPVCPTCYGMREANEGVEPLYRCADEFHKRGEVATPDTPAPLTPFGVEREKALAWLTEEYKQRGLSVTRWTAAIQNEATQLASYYQFRAAPPVERAAGETTHCCEHSEAYTRLAKRANQLERIIGNIALLLREGMTQ